MKENIQAFIEQNKEELLKCFNNGESFNVNDVKSSIVNALYKLWSSSIPTEKLYDSCLDVDTVHSARLVVNREDKISYLISDYETIKQMKRFLSSDFNDAERSTKGSNLFGLITAVYPTFEDSDVRVITEENAREYVFKTLESCMSKTQVEYLKEKGIRVVYCNRKDGHRLV